MKVKMNNSLLKTPTGIAGLDEITYGGFPTGRPVLVCGNAGCGKTLLAAQFIVKGITDYNEPGVFMSFEESSIDLSKNLSSLGFNLDDLKKQNMLRIDQVKIERHEIEETGEYDLEGLFIRLNHAIDSIGAKRVVLDTIESIFSGFESSAVLRSEIRRLFFWLKEKGVTTVITGERGENSFTRQGLEEYVSDCVILLDFRVVDQIATRRLRIVKYRGSMHGTNEYPFLIDEEGINVLPITSLRLDYKSSKEIISTGLKELDELFSTKGLYRSNSVLITGTAGTAKTTLAAYFALGSCKRNENTLLFSFEESPDMLIRNMLEVGIDLKPYLKSNLLTIQASRPSLQGLEMHLILMYKLIRELKPQMIIVDPISSFITVGSDSEVRAMLVRLLDMIKQQNITSVFTALTHGYTNEKLDTTVDAVSSLSDTWINLQNESYGGERVRSMLIVKSRGMGHADSQQVFKLNKKGIHFITDNINK
jgi:circadian clock protein KaiC